MLNVQSLLFGCLACLVGTSVVNADGRVFVLGLRNLSGVLGFRDAQQGCASQHARLASVEELRHAVAQCFFSQCARGWLHGGTVGTTVCDLQGSSLKAVNVRTENGTEDTAHLNAFCIKDKAEACGDPPSFPNARLQEHSGSEMGDELLYTCLPGFVMPHGHAAFSLLCDSCGEWYGTVQICVKDKTESHVDYEDKFEDSHEEADHDRDSQEEHHDKESEEVFGGASQEGKISLQQQMTRFRIDVAEEHQGQQKEHDMGATVINNRRAFEGESAKNEEQIHTRWEQERSEVVRTDAAEATEEPVSLLSQKHLFWFPSEAFQDEKLPLSPSSVTQTNQRVSDAQSQESKENESQERHNVSHPTDVDDHDDEQDRYDDLDNDDRDDHDDSRHDDHDHDDHDDHDHDDHDDHDHDDHDDHDNNDDHEDDLTDDPDDPDSHQEEDDDRVTHRGEHEERRDHDDNNDHHNKHEKDRDHIHHGPQEYDNRDDLYDEQHSHEDHDDTTDEHSDNDNEHPDDSEEHPDHDDHDDHDRTHDDNDDDDHLPDHDIHDDHKDKYDKSYEDHDSHEDDDDGHSRVIFSVATERRPNITQRGAGRKSTKDETWLDGYPVQGTKNGESTKRPIKPVDGEHTVKIPDRPNEVDVRRRIPHTNSPGKRQSPTRAPGLDRGVVEKVRPGFRIPGTSPDHSQPSDSTSYSDTLDYDTQQVSPTHSWLDELTEHPFLDHGLAPPVHDGDIFTGMIGERNVHNLPGEMGEVEGEMGEVEGEMGETICIDDNCPPHPPSSSSRGPTVAAVAVLVCVVAMAIIFGVWCYKRQQQKTSVYEMNEKGQSPTSQGQQMEMQQKV